MDIGEWLRGLGLQSYEQTFRDNGIDLAILPQLTVDDLKEIGVQAVGHRRKILDAIGLLPTRPGGGSGARIARAPSADAHVRRSCRLDGPQPPSRSGRAARDHARLPEFGGGRNCATGWSRREVLGRRRSRLFRLAASKRRRGRASSPSGPCGRQSGERHEGGCRTPAASAHWYRHRSCGRGRSDRRRRSERGSGDRGHT